MVTLFKNSVINNDAPSSIYPRVAHELPPVGSQIWGPIQTNNSFSNILLDTQTWPVWTLPYLLWIVRDGTSDHGVAVNHTERSQIVFGPENLSPPQYYFNPPRIKLWAFTGVNWTSVDVAVVSSSKLATTIKVSNGNGTLTMPLVYGMGFVTGVYSNVLPVLHSAVGVQEFRTISVLSGRAKYWIKLFDQKVWTIYVSDDPTNQLTLVDPNHIQASSVSSRCVIQICKGDSTIYDSCCGQYQVDATLSGEVDPDTKTGRYSFNYVLEGTSASGTGLVWALPHHQAQLDDETRTKNTGLVLDSPTKGQMKAYVTKSLGMKIWNLPTDIGFEPWTSVSGFSFDWANYTCPIKSQIRDVALVDAQQDILANCDLDSMYFGGKQLDKYACMAWVSHYILRDSTVTLQILPRLKLAIEKYAKNYQQNPLVYDETWKGLISSAPKYLDFGNLYYNDHHFHYGYHVHAVALVAAIDPNWLNDSSNNVFNYTTTLIRDYFNPIDSDPYFPQFRNFDWFHGHSFAHGIFPSGDGKNEESSSEDYHSVYAVKLFAKVINNELLEMAATLMLGIMRESLNRYMLYLSNNVDQPAEFIANKVSGILFENKIDYATFFGRGTVGDEYVHGIHMIPITPVSSYIRGETFTSEEWDSKLKGIVDSIPDGWRGLIELNRALFDPKASWAWFTRSDWTDVLIDGGMSRTWSLAYLAGIGAAK